MFTGIVDHVGKVKEIQNIAAAKRIYIETHFNHLQLGESIAMDGACLTVAGHNGNTFFCDVSPETLKLTILQHWQVGQAVNLERSLMPHDRLGGHFVTGHIDQTAHLKFKKNIGDFLELTFSGINTQMQALLVKKGSVAVNGVSLTINEIFPSEFQVMLIPHTLQRTNLGLLQPGDNVNIEFDMLAKMIDQQFKNYIREKNETFTL